ncbi:hypothetical protein BT63DRAFT_424035 [Microthyrium microscopicum]|uniref:nitric-oxide synthase (NADPH) n=1 Tax=Microthyrium microscopicum TaxID=703497 RepID=A0A6A6UCU0_9PEZI|nr:hypothetical protein BT63DRAFT_424035 [Microthyrium microscopicum]
MSEAISSLQNLAITSPPKEAFVGASGEVKPPSGVSSHEKVFNDTETIQPTESILADGTISKAYNGVAAEVVPGIVPNNSLPPPCAAGMKVYKEAQKEFDRIRNSHRTLAPTGCTPEFCQSGRMVSTNEPRVGRNRPLAEIQQEAVDFLRECRDHDVIESDENLDKRIKEALVQISNTAIVAAVTDKDGHTSEGLAGGTWYQLPEELEYGLRASWRNARRCIMRSEHEHLALCDLRRVQSSREMARTIAKGMQEAFNRGHILPTVFVFPPRQPGKKGPMIWNNQIMAFAGYKLDDGSILGDPANVDLTEGMIEFGWKPPINKTRWDFLPLITMAENDEPYMMELPQELRRTVSITHPRYEKEFRELDLRWVLAPALSRLGFDIGGNQYTASPFIGWFMDAEIGIRNLADSFRYNVLPDVIDALKMSPEPETDFDDLPEYMRLVALSRAQAELNFAVYYSYLHDHVHMIDTLSGSIEYQNYDEDRNDEIGYRLPAEPYWISPPQGSIVPIWHKGGLPNYQPKPMVCKHLQDPVNAWRRETPEEKRRTKKGLIKTITDANEARPRLRIFSCSAGVNAGKMAHKLYETMQRLVHEVDDPFDVEVERPLNQLDLAEAGPEDIILIIASTTGRGEIPRNAKRFVERWSSAETLSSPPRFSCFANGDSTYGDTYNIAGKTIQQLMTTLGCRPLLGHCFAGDTAINNPDWESFTHWLENIDHLILGNHHKIQLPTSLTDMGHQTTTMVEMPTATLVKKTQLDPKGIVHITLDVGDKKYQEMDHVKILAPNPDYEVERALAALKLAPEERFTWHHQDAINFLSRYVDLDHCFKELDWYPGFSCLSEEKQTELRNAKALAVIEGLENINYDSALLEKICKDMASIVPRLYSVASCPVYSNTDAIKEEDSGNVVDIMVKVNPSGRFSEVFLLNAKIGAQMRFGLTSPDTWQLIQAQKPNAPLIAIATGSGIGPVRALLQRRMIDITRTTGGTGRPRGKMSSVTAEVPTSIYSGSRRGSVSSIGSGSRRGIKDINHHAHLGVGSTRGSVSLFAGFKTEDSDLIQTIIRPASHTGILDIVELCPSNSEMVRIQDHILLQSVKDKLAEKLRDPSCIVFVCANEWAAEGAVVNLSLIAGGNVKDLLAERYIEEIFRG